MRTVLVRLVQAGLVVLLGVAGYHIYVDNRDAQRQHNAAVAISLGDDVVLGPAGIGKLALGMSVADANATGQVRVPADWTKTSTSTCYAFTTGGTGIHFSRDHGLAVITAAQTVRTPEGIGAGAGIADVTKAYPKLNHTELGTPEQQESTVGYLAAPVPGNPAANYIFVFHLGGGGPKPAKVQVVLLALDEQGKQCTGAG